MREVKLSSFMDNEVMEFSRYTISERALPDINGLKPIHKRILWAMYRGGMYSNKPRQKGTAVQGETMKFTPHGDSSIYDALVRLSNDSVNYPLVDSQGAMSSKNSTNLPAAPRYTSFRLTELSEMCLEDIKKNGVIMGLNYDGEYEEPETLPTPFPLILCNTNIGIAVGIATGICSFNMEEVIQTTINLINNKPTKPMYPDFATKGVVIRDDEEAKKVKETGRGKFTLRATYDIDKKNRTITFNSLPYTTTREKVIETILDKIKDGTITELTSVEDMTSKDGLEIELKYKTTADLDILIAKLFSKTPLEDTFNCNFNVLIDGIPNVLGTDEMLLEWVRYRLESIRRIKNYELNQLEDKLHNLKGLEKVIANLDKTIDIIRNSSESKVMSNLKKELKVDDIQAEHIANMKLRNLNSSSIDSKIKDIKKLEKEIEEINKTLSSEKELKNVIIKQLKDISKKFKKERQTQIIDKEEVIDYKDIKQEVLEQELDYNVRVLITKDNYVKKIPLTSLRGNFTIEIKTGDEIIYDNDNLSNLEELLIFTNKGNVYKRKLYELQDDKPSTLGSYIPSYLELQDEEVIYMTLLENDKHLIIGYDNGKVSKVSMESYETKTNRNMLKNAYNMESKPIFFYKADKDIDLLAVSNVGNAILLSTDFIAIKSTRNTQGNIFMKLKDSQAVKEYKVGTKIYETYRLVNSGYGKKYKS